MASKRILVTGSSGLIGSEVCTHFSRAGWQVHGFDNNQREIFFGPDGETRWNQNRLCQTLPDFQHWEIDIRDRAGISEAIGKIKPDLVVHAAAQPSHDLAAKIPFDDFDTNAVGTLNMLEAVRAHAPDSPLVYFSTNKVYGDAPNQLPLVELETRWDFSEPEQRNGISESLSIDQCTHSLFGVSKAAADLLVQEYGRYFGLATCCLRGGCLTGPSHSGVELHGFLSYLVKCNVMGKPYTVFGYKGKQVRDNIHSADVASFIEAFYHAPRQGEVYNLGGGRDNSCSILEAFSLVESITGRAQQYAYDETARIGDHICYYSDLRKIAEHFPRWRQQYTLLDTLREIADSWRQRITHP